MCITSGTEPVEQKCLDEFQVYKIKQEITQPAQIQNTVVHIPYYGLIVKHFLGTIIMGRKPGFGALYPSQKQMRARVKPVWNFGY